MISPPHNNRIGGGALANYMRGKSRLGAMVSDQIYVLVASNTMSVRGRIFLISRRAKKRPCRWLERRTCGSTSSYADRTRVL